jgi:hypothetical protein
MAEQVISFSRPVSPPAWQETIPLDGFLFQFQFRIRAVHFEIAPAA